MFDVVKRIFTTLLLVGLTGQFVGCDSQASQAAQAQRQLDAAVAKLNLANVGFVPEGAENDELLAHRQSLLEEVYAELDPVIQSNAPEQKAQALMLSADLDASFARHASRTAALEQSALADRSTVLMGYLAAMEGAAGRSEALKPNAERALTELQAEIDELKNEQAELTAQVDELDGKLQAVNAEVQGYQAKADEGYAAAQSLNEKAFVSSGDRMYDLQDQASEAERQAAVQSANAEQRQVIADDLSAKLLTARLQLDKVNKLIEKLSKQVSDTRADAERQTDRSAEAAQQSAEALKTLSAEYTQLAQAHADLVESRMDDAVDKAAQAVASLQQAQSLSQGSAAESVKVELLAAYVNQAHVLSEYKGYLDNLADTTTAILHSVDTAAPQGSAAFRSKLDALSAKSASLKEQADAAIAAGNGLVLELAPDGSTTEEGGVVAIALSQQQRLDDYSERLGS